MGRLPGTIILCIFLVLSVGATAGTLSLSEDDHYGLVASGSMASSKDLHSRFFGGSAVGLDAVCWLRPSCPSRNEQDIGGVTRSPAPFSRETSPRSDRWGLEFGLEPVQDYGAFASMTADALYGASTEPQGSAGPVIERIPVIELPLPPAFPLLATGVAALLIFAHRPRHR